LGLQQAIQALPRETRIKSTTSERCHQPHLQLRPPWERPAVTVIPRRDGRFFDHETINEVGTRRSDHQRGERTQRVTHQADSLKPTPFDLCDRVVAEVDERVPPRHRGTAMTEGGQGVAVELMPVELGPQSVPSFRSTRCTMQANDGHS
jgi:hypothetical protein